MKNYVELEHFLTNSLQQSVLKEGFSRVVFGLSGGLDSAVVALLAKKAFKDNHLCLMMPSFTSNESSLNDAKNLCENHNLNYEIIDISPTVLSYVNKKDMNELRVGNFTSRVRMSVLYDISARENALVLGSSNKSEILLGYGTHYGDFACAINPIGDIYKSDLFDFASFLGVDENIIKKPPSADLWRGQSDEDELGFSYKKIDELLRAYEKSGFNVEKMDRGSFEKRLYDTIMSRVKNNRFKRELPLVLKLK